jgi:hypothetical protein
VSATGTLAPRGGADVYTDTVSFSVLSNTEHPLEGSRDTKIIGLLDILASLFLKSTRSAFG